jgi:hypothetical protein
VPKDSLFLYSPLPFLWGLLSCLFLNHALAQDIPEDKVWTVMKSNDFSITGDGSAVNWQEVKWLSLPQRRETGAQYQTQVKLLYSESGIYCLYRCEDAKITATLKEDFLDLWNEDVVEAFFWTDENEPVYFEYELSPLNYELPILVPNFKGRFFGWRPWHYEGDRKTRHATNVTTKNGEVSFWTAEFFIPFALLNPLKNVPPQKGTRWRANFYRIDYDKGSSTWAWQATEKTFHDYEKFGTLIFQ